MRPPAVFLVVAIAVAGGARDARAQAAPRWRAYGGLDLAVLAGVQREGAAGPALSAGVSGRRLGLEVAYARLSALTTGSTSSAFVERGPGFAIMASFLVWGDLPRSLYSSAGVGVLVQGSTPRHGRLADAAVSFGVGLRLSRRMAVELRASDTDPLGRDNLLVRVGLRVERGAAGPPH
jgi:hypothetical protein